MTSVTAPIALTWRRLEPPLPPGAVVARGGAARRLAGVAAAAVDVGVDLGAAVGDDWVVIVGDESSLPWVDGAIYTAWQSGVLVPTTTTTDPDMVLVAGAVRRRADTRPGDMVVLLPVTTAGAGLGGAGLRGGQVLVGPRPTGPADPARLRAFADAARAEALS